MAVKVARVAAIPTAAMRACFIVFLPEGGQPLSQCWARAGRLGVPACGVRLPMRMRFPIGIPPVVAEDGSGFGGEGRLGIARGDMRR